MNEVKQQSIGNYTVDCIAEYGDEVNRSRHVPSMEDGLKPIQKRLILAALQFPAGQFIKTQELLAKTMGFYHPHGVNGTENVVADLVRVGILIGKGNHGDKGMFKWRDFNCAAPRYTKVMVEPKFRSVVSKLLPYVPSEINELGNNEPFYIPTPYPIGLQMESFGIGIGLQVSLPAFTSDSIIKAGYAARQGKPSPWGYLKADGLEIASDVRDFWFSHKGSITYKFNVTPGWSGGLNGWFITGKPSGFTKPNCRTLFKLKDEGGKVVIRDESAKEEKKLFVARSKRIKTISDSDIEIEVEKASSVRRHFMLNVLYKNQTRPITGGEWIQACMINYEHLVERFKQDSLNKLDDDIKVYEHFRPISDLILNSTKTYPQIGKEVGVETKIVERIASMKISTLRELDPAKKIEKLQQTKEYYNNLTVKDMLKEYLTC